MHVTSMPGTAVIPDAPPHDAPMRFERPTSPVTRPASGPNAAIEPGGDSLTDRIACCPGGRLEAGPQGASAAGVARPGERREREPGRPPGSAGPARPPFFGGFTRSAFRTRSDRGQSTVEYALLVIGIATLALLVLAWASSTDVVASIFDRIFGWVGDQIG